MSEVLWTQVLTQGYLIAELYGGVLVYVVFGIWAFFTLAILVMMEGLSAFLHTLRLHWYVFGIRFEFSNENHFYLTGLSSWASSSKDLDTNSSHSALRQLLTPKIIQSNKLQKYFWKEKIKLLPRCVVNQCCFEAKSSAKFRKIKMKRSGFGQCYSGLCRRCLIVLERCIEKFHNSHIT